LRAAFCLAVAANLSVMGAAIFQAAMAPWALYGLVGLPLLVAMVSYWRHDEAERAMVVRALHGLGLVLLMAPVVAAPGVAWQYASYQPRLALSPLPPRGVPPLAEAPQRIILVTFDSLRYRTTSLAAPERRFTPALSALAAEGTWYTNCRSASDRTLVSMPTVLSGVRPSDFYAEVDNRSGFLRAGLLTGLGGLLAPAGYQAFYASMLIDPAHIGLSAEFQGGQVLNPLFKPSRFDDGAFLPVAEAIRWVASSALGFLEPVTAPVHPVTATRDTFAHARRLLRDASGRTFLWVHIGAPHDPYFDVPAADLGGALHPERYARVDETELVAADGPSLARYEKTYEAYTRFADAEFGRFVRGLKADGLWDASLVVVTADHGESFTPSLQLHGREILSEDVTHVPLIIRVPGRAGGQRVDRLTAHEDIVPTLLATVYGQVPPVLRGKDLFARGLTGERTVYTWADYSHRVATRHRPRGSLVAYRGHLKYTSRRIDGRETLHDLAADPTEKRDLSRTRRAELEALRAAAHREIGW
jgi:arylsulfatase A-like enzyme